MATAHLIGFPLVESLVFTRMEHILDPDTEVLSDVLKFGWFCEKNNPEPDKGSSVVHTKI